MGCACKNKLNKAMELIPDMNEYKSSHTVERKGLKKICFGIGTSIWNFFLKIMTLFAVLIVILPLTVFTAFKIAFGIKSSIRLPLGFIKKMKTIEEEYG